MVASAGSFLKEDGDDVRLPHRWTPGGVGVRSAFTGGHVLNLAVAACVLNDLYREAEAGGVELRGVRVRAEGGFGTSCWKSTGISYAVEVDSDAPQARIAALSLFEVATHRVKGREAQQARPRAVDRDV
ncbi:hypothetical protein [Streptomyces sp. NPDC048720]|uniref:hypothetical protein n=1 Tax=Streptomyces sp. NPDC048720 TaxID=3365588 RepID=UPI003714C9EF